MKMWGRLFPYSFEGQASTWYFVLEVTSINYWKQFEASFLQKFRDDSTQEDHVIELSSLRIKPKKGVRDFNQRFCCLKNKIPATVLPAKERLIAYYINAFPTIIAMWVKRDRKTTLQAAFAEAVLVEKDMFGLKDNPDLEPDQPSTSRRRQENVSKPAPQNKDPYDKDNMKKILQNMA